MHIPKKLKVGGHIYTVTLVEEHTSHHIDTGKEQGACRSASNEIYLDKNQARSQMEATFIHELMHAINGELNHELLTSLAEQLYQVLNDAKMLR